jgi:hypothetical protein
VECPEHVRSHHAGLPEGSELCRLKTAAGDPKGAEAFFARRTSRTDELHAPDAAEVLDLFERQRRGLLDRIVVLGVVRRQRQRGGSRLVGSELRG